LAIGYWWLIRSFFLPRLNKNPFQTENIRLPG